MKKFIKYFMFLLLGTLLITTAITTASCDKAKRELTPPDSVFQNRIDAYLPIAMQKMYEFDSPTDVVLYKQERLRQLQFDSIFTSLPDQTLANICAVLSKQQSKYGISDIVYEYNANRRIYSALPPDPPLPEEPEKKPDSTDSTVAITPFSVQL